jgi:hypothetical protein
MMLIVLLVAFYFAATAFGRRYPRVGLGMGYGAILLSVSVIVSVALFGADGPGG